MSDAFIGVGLGALGLLGLAVLVRFVLLPAARRLGRIPSGPPLTYDEKVQRIEGGEDASARVSNRMREQPDVVHLIGGSAPPRFDPVDDTPAIDGGKNQARTDD